MDVFVVLCHNPYNSAKLQYFLIHTTFLTTYIISYNNVIFNNVLKTLLFLVMSYYVMTFSNI